MTSRACSRAAWALAATLALLVPATAGANEVTILEVAPAQPGAETTSVERSVPRLQPDPRHLDRPGIRVDDTRAGITILVESLAVTGDGASAQDNDFTRIAGGLAAAAFLGAGTTVRLEGVFDWTEAFANAEWIDNDYCLMLPGGVDDITVTAASLGSAVIQGPGELPDVYWEGFLCAWGATYRDWTFSNLDIRGFEWALQFFYTTSGGSSTDFNGLTVSGNRIDMPADLNEVAAGSAWEAFQNVAIHLGFGSDQTISGNEIVLPGDGVSDSAAGAYAASVVLQSNSSGSSATFQGLLIEGNTIRITAAQSEDPERIYGIWENTQAHLSDITIRGNLFVNEHPDNDPEANFQRAFRITAHSSATTTVLYEGNRVSGANIAFHWLGDGFSSAPPPWVEPVLLRSNDVTGNATGVWVHTDNGTADSKAMLVLNRLAGNGVGLRSEDAVVTAEDNWWGCNDGPGESGCDSAVALGLGSLDADPWLVLGVAIDPSSVTVGESGQVTASLRLNSDEVDTAPTGHFLPDGVPVAFAATGGSVAPAIDPLAAGLAETIFTAGDSAGFYEVTATVDGETVAAGVVVVTVPGATLLFADGFESGGTGAWSATEP